MVFTFEHPAKGVRDHEGQELTDYRGLPLTDNRRSATLSWTVEQDNVMHGFGGYFDCTLFGNEMISIVPSTHSPGMISWFPVFIPIKVCSFLNVYIKQYFFYALFIYFFVCCITDTITGRKR